MSRAQAIDGGRGTSAITRELLEADGIRQLMRARHPDVPLNDEASMRRSLADTLAARPAREDDGVWLFAYGSLLWNPCIRVGEQSPAHLHGYHRDFRLRMTYGRGTPETPGLMLGLTPGGSCRGVGLRIAERNLATELPLVWRREMLTGVYCPRWVRLQSPGGRVHAIAFIVNREHRCYCGPLDEERVVELIRSGRGLLGSCAGYLASTVEQLQEHGIRDRHLEHLHLRVSASGG